MSTDNAQFITDLCKQHGTHIALQLSGGRDSLATWSVLRDMGLLDAITVYWVNTGDAFPETLAIITEVRSQTPHFVEIAGNQPEVIGQFGMPTDILGRNCTPIGLMCGQGTVRMQDSYSCCGRVIMQPLHERMLADGITLIIRGQREQDSHKAPVKSGDTECGIQYLFPIEDWTEEEVDACVAESGLPRHPCYDFMTSTPDCMSCSGWWEERRAPYLKAHHPEAFAEYQRRLELIRASTERLIQTFNLEYGDDQ